MLLLREMVRAYNVAVYDKADPRSKDWFLMGSPLPVITITIFYLLFVKIWGPAFMKNRQPFNLDKIILIYNFFQVISCGYLAIAGIYYLYSPWGRYNLLCEKLDFTDNEFNMFLVGNVYNYFLTKLLDLFDTVFFVLRKKQAQITFLHIYHHVMMVLIAWIGVKFLPGGNAAFVGVANSSVHTIMYSYYFMANIHKDVLWWKKYVTQIQMLQFASIAAHSLAMLMSDCEFPKLPILALFPQNVFMMVMFWDFYKRKYVKPQISKTT